MQFHLNGFRAGDPEAPASEVPAPAAAPAPLPETTDVLIVGCGPAGLTLAAQLAAFPGLSTRILEQKAGPLALRRERHRREASRTRTTPATSMPRQT